MPIFKRLMREYKSAKTKKTWLCSTGTGTGYQIEDKETVLKICYRIHFG